MGFERETASAACHREPGFDTIAEIHEFIGPGDDPPPPGDGREVDRELRPIRQAKAVPDVPLRFVELWLCERRTEGFGETTALLVRRWGHHGRVLVNVHLTKPGWNQPKHPHAPGFRSEDDLRILPSFKRIRVSSPPKGDFTRRNGKSSSSRTTSGTCADVEQGVVAFEENAQGIRSISAQSSTCCRPSPRLRL